MKMTTTHRRVLFAVWLLATFAYLLWRVLASLNPGAPVYSALFLALETYALVCSAIFYWIVHAPSRPMEPAPGPPRTVDVFICTYNESPDLLRQTVRRALAMPYPHRTWLCDDGNRPEMRALAEELGCGYFARGRNDHFKAGNLNHALSKTDGELILVLDADHLVRPDLLARLAGYFSDPKVALVQIPQVFYNVDSFQHHLRADRRLLWHEGALFHHRMQPGADRMNASLFVGTGAVLRRTALQEIGGFATGSVTEDVHTSMRLHARGWRTVYHDEPLGYLLAPESLLQYLTQRLRWGQGSMQILRRENPLFVRGLSWRQRVVYFSALSSFAQAVVHLAYYLAPAIFLLGGPAPLQATRLVDFLPVLAHVFVDLAMFKLMLGPLARPLLAECYKLLNVYAFLKSLGGLAGNRRLRFQVTTKGRDAGATFRLLVPQFLLVALNLGALGAGLLRLLTAREPGAALGILVASGFCAFFVLVGAMAVLFAWDRIATRSEYTIPDRIVAMLGPPPGRPGPQSPVTVLRANDRELHAVLRRGDAPPAVGETCAVQVELFPEEPAPILAGRVASVRGAGKGAVVIYIELVPLDRAVRDRLADRFALTAIPRMIHGLMGRWSPERGDRVTGETGSHYLPLEPNVL